MKTTFCIPVLISSIFILHGCGGGGGSDPATTTTVTPQVFSSSVTDIKIVRIVDQQAIPVSGLPATGADITVE
jgi:hypothetical protein